MPRSSTYSPACTINFQTDEQTRDAVHAEARRQDRSASAVIRLAIRAYLKAAPPITAQRQSPTSTPAPLPLSQPTERRAAAGGEKLCLNATAGAGDTTAGGAG